MAPGLVGSRLRTLWKAGEGAALCCTGAAKPRFNLLVGQPGTHMWVFLRAFCQKPVVPG